MSARRVKKEIAADTNLAAILSRSEFGPPTPQLGLKPLNNAAVHLTNATLAQIQGGTDLLHRQFFIIVQDDDQAFVAIQTLGHETHQVACQDIQGRTRLNVGQVILDRRHV